MNLEFSHQRLEQVVSGLLATDFKVKRVSPFVGNPNGIRRDTELFFVEIEETDLGRFGVRMDGLGMMSVCQIYDEETISLIKISTAQQAVDILGNFKHNDLHHHLTRAH